MNAMKSIGTRMKKHFGKAKDKAVDYAEKKIHDKKKDIALDVIDSTMDKVASKQKMHLKASQELIEDKFAKGKTLKGKKKWIKPALSGKKGIVSKFAEKKGIIKAGKDLTLSSIRKVEKVATGKMKKRAIMAETLIGFNKKRFGEEGMNVDGNEYDKLTSRAYQLAEMMESLNISSYQYKILNEEYEEVRNRLDEIEEGEEYAKGSTVTTNEGVIESFLSDKKELKVGNLSTHYSTMGDVVLLRNYGTLIAKRKGKTVSISTKKYSVTTTKIQNMIERMANNMGLKVEKIGEDEFAKGGGVYQDYDDVISREPKYNEYMKNLDKKTNKVIGEKNVVYLPFSDVFRVYKTKEYAQGGVLNGNYLDTISNDKKNEILKNIANHYGISVEEAKAEVIDADAEMLYEYIANDKSLRMSVYNDFEYGKFAEGSTVKGGGVGELKAIPKGNKGLPKLPESVRNKMGYMKDGGMMAEALALQNKYKGTSEYKEVASISDSLNFIKNHISIGKTEQTADLAGTIRTEILFDKKLVGYYDIDRNEDSYIYAISKEKTKNAKGVFVKKSVENPHSLSKGTGYAKYKYFVFSNYKMSIDEDVFEDAITDMIRNKYKYEDGAMMENGGYIELMGEGFDDGINKLRTAWFDWVNAPMTTSEDIRLAKSDVLEHIKGMLDEKYRTGGVAGSKHVSVTKGYRLPHGYKAVKGSDKSYTYSKGHKGVRVDAGWRLPKGYEVVEGSYDMKYEHGTTLGDCWSCKLNSNEKEFACSVYNRMITGHPFCNEETLKNCDKKHLLSAIEKNMNSFSNEGKKLATSIVEKIK